MVVVLIVWQRSWAAKERVNLLRGSGLRLLVTHHIHTTRPWWRGLRKGLTAPLLSALKLLVPMAAHLKLFVGLSTQRAMKTMESLIDVVASGHAACVSAAASAVSVQRDLGRSRLWKVAFFC